ncbi:MAG: NYN domain-containing protein [Caldilineaceae bacterium]|nr:NYN domain-containing protein [Caldilineaceae bacterium]
MPLLIDGHNLIGSNVFADIRLTDIDDEAKLVARLRAWKSRYPGKIEVIFDHGITEGRSQLSGGGVEVRFARNPTDADELIKRRVRHPKKDLILVTNDAALRMEAQRHNVPVWRSDEFIEKIFDAPVQLPHAPKRPKPPEDEPPREVADAHLDEWMRLFKDGKGMNEDDPTWSPPFKPTKRRRSPKARPSRSPDDARPQKKSKHGKRKR